MRKVIFFAMAVVACVTISASADVASWQAQAAATANNVVADNTGWTFDGSTGLSYDYGDLSNGDTGSAGPGASIEYIFNLADSGTSVALGTVNGWANVEKNGMKLEQWSDTGVFGSGIEGYWDLTFDSVPSIFDTDVHAVFVYHADGNLELFVDGVSKGTDGRDGGWVTNGGVSSLGSTSSLTADIAVGTIYAVGTYDRALTSAEITDLYSSYLASPQTATNPEPSNGQPDVALDTDLKWDNPTAYVASNYALDFRANDANWLDTGNTFTTATVVDLDVDPDTTTAAVPAGILPLTNLTPYYWRVISTEPNITGMPIDYVGPDWWFTTVPGTATVTNPISVTEPLSGTATLTVTHERGTSYSWFKNGVEYSSGALVVDGDIVLAISPLAVADEGLYHCEVYNSAGPYPTPHPDAVSTEARVMVRRLVAHWAFEDTLVDSVDGWVGVYNDPNENNPNPDPSADYYYIDDANAISGKAFDLRNSEKFIIVSDSNDFFNFHAQGFTANCWVKIDEDGDWELAFAKTMMDRSAGWGLGRYSGTGFMGNRGSNLYPDNFGGEITVGQNTWHMVTIQYDPDTLSYKMYVDGELVSETGEVSQEIAIGNEPLTIGAETYTGRAPINAVIDEVQIWSYALEPLDIALMYTSASGNIACLDGEGLQYDWDNDCVVGLSDFAEFALSWLNCRQVPTCLY